MKSLFQINHEYQQLLEEIEQNEGVLAPEDEALLRINREELQAKTLNYVQFLQQLRADVALGKAEIARCQEYIQAKGRVIDRLETVLVEAVQTYGTIETGTYKVSTRKSESVEFTGDTDDLPPAFKRHKIVTEPDKAAIKTGLKSGVKLPGCQLVEKHNLQIK